MERKRQTIATFSFGEARDIAASCARRTKDSLSTLWEYSKLLPTPLSAAIVRTTHSVDNLYTHEQGGFEDGTMGQTESGETVIFIPGGSDVSFEVEGKLVNVIDYRKKSFANPGNSKVVIEGFDYKVYSKPNVWHNIPANGSEISIKRSDSWRDLKKEFLSMTASSEDK